MGRTLIENLQKFIEVLVSWAPQYQFEPQAVEISFGMEEGLKPWLIDLGDGHWLRLRGRIDRVDLQRQDDGSAYTVVIDYKSGGQELEQIKLDNGLDLQLLAYLGVLRDAANSGAVFGAARLVPAGAFYVSLRTNAGSGATRLEVLADAGQAHHAGYQHRGRFRDDLLRAFDCREQPKGNQFRYAVKKDGEFSKNANEVLSATAFLALVDQVQNFLREYGREIFQGEVRLAPYRCKQETACDRCHYLSACRFDSWTEPYRVLKSAS